MKKPASRKNLGPELEELRVSLVSAIPIIGNELGSILGRKLPRMSARGRASLERKLDQLMRSTIPHIRKLEELRDKPNVDLERIIALDHVLTGFLRSAGWKLRSGADPWEALLQLAAKQAIAPRAKWAEAPTYIGVQQALWDFLVHLYTHAAPAQISSAIDEWSGTDDARRYLHSVRLIEAASRRFRVQLPKRLTDRLLLDLQQEYTLSASIFEARLRVLVLLAENVEGRPQPWAFWRNKNLHNLLAMAGRHKSLGAVVSSIDRNVRNALVHASPVVDLASGTCRFEDLKGAVTWTWREFFDQTRGLTLSVLAMIRFDSLQRFIHAQALVRNLRYFRNTLGG
jgi:hypothetical protein